MNRINIFLNPVINPSPDFSVVHQNENDVWVLCVEEKPMYEVCEWLKKERGGGWIARTYFSETIADNPRHGSLGWMWRMTKT